jgi:hypothetical protein
VRLPFRDYQRGNLKMTLLRYITPHRFGFGCFLLLICTWALASGQENRPKSETSVVDDWTMHQVIFSNPGTEEDAIREGRHEEWRHILASHRYRMQQAKRNSPWMNRIGRGSKDKRDWNVQIAPAGESAMAAGTYPAKFTVYPITAPNCANDFVVYGVNQPGSATQANIVGYTNLYKGFCTTGSVPTLKFAYYVGTGTVQTSPVLSEDGTMIAFVESNPATGATLHVVKIGTSGSQGTAYNAPLDLTSGSANGAVDYKVVLNNRNPSVAASSNGTGVIDTYSSPYVDYENDRAFVGDDNGNLHQIQPILNATASNPPAEIVVNPTGHCLTCWPLNNQQANEKTSGPIYDEISGKVFLGGQLGYIWADIPYVSPSNLGGYYGSLMTGGNSFNTPVLDPPILDETHQTLFAVSNNGTNGQVTQTNTVLDLTQTVPGAPTYTSRMVQAVIGSGTGNGTPGNSTTSLDLHDGAFSNTYYTSTGGVAGRLFLCGTLNNAATPALMEIGFAASGSGLMNTVVDGYSPIQLAATGDEGTNYDCSPLTEVYNPNNGQDLLFVSVRSGGLPSSSSSSCGGNSCLISVNIDTTIGNNGLLGTINSVFPLNAGGGVTGTGGIVIDGTYSGTTGAAQIYFGSQTTPFVYQASQAALQ